jgi:hypothetical protein
MIAGANVYIGGLVTLSDSVQIPMSACYRSERRAVKVIDVKEYIQ